MTMIMNKKNFKKSKTLCTVFFWDVLQHVKWEKNQNAYRFSGAYLYVDGVTARSILPGMLHISIEFLFQPKNIN